MSEINIFICSSENEEDGRLYGQLYPQLLALHRSRFIHNIWSNQNISGGLMRDKEINEYLQHADIILLLVSPDFVGSEECHLIAQKAIQQTERRRVRVIPVLLRPVWWKDAPYGELEALPERGGPISSWKNEDEALYKVADGIRSVVQELNPPLVENVLLPIVPPPVNNALTVPGPPIIKVKVKQEHVFSGHLGPVASVAFSSDGELLASDSWDHAIVLHDKAKRVLYTLKDQNMQAEPLYSVAFSPDTKSVISGGQDKMVKVWNASGGVLARTLSGHIGPIAAVAFGTDGRTIVSGSDDSTIKVWDAQTGKLIRTLRGHRGSVTSLALSFDMKTMVSGSHDETIKVWDMASGEELFELKGYGGSVFSVALSSDMQLLASGHDNKTIKIWDMRTKSELATLVGHAERVFSVAFSPDSRIVVSGSHDTTIKLWDRASTTMLDEIKGHSQAVLCVAFHPDGSLIASGSLDKTVGIWRVEYVQAEKTEDTGNDSVVLPVPASPATDLAMPDSFDRPKALRKRDGLLIKRTCPSCNEEFYPGDCEIVSTVKSGLTLKAAPQGWRRLWSRIRPEKLIGPIYTQELACRKCPYCKYLLPSNIERVQNISIAVIGGSGAGKSHYMAALFHQMENELSVQTQRRFRLIKTAYTEEAVRREYLTPVFSHKQTLPPTQIATGKERNPLIYELVTDSSTVNLIFYDIASEDYLLPERLVRVYPHLFNSDAIIFLADPIMIPGIWNSLPAFLQYKPETSVVQKSNTSLLTTTLGLFERVGGPQSNKFLRSMPIAITLSKSDLLKQFAPIQPYRFLSNPQYSIYPDLKDLAVVDQEVRAIVNDFGERPLLQEALWGNMRFFAVSATGYAPDNNGLYPAVKPIRCLDPFIWILYQLRIIEAV